MDKIGLSSKEQGNVLRIAASVLQLGNIVFVEEQEDKKGMLFGLVGEDGAWPSSGRAETVLFCQVLQIKFVLFIIYFRRFKSLNDVKHFPECGCQPAAV